MPFPQFRLNASKIAKLEKLFARKYDNDSEDDVGEDET
jgi:hypothetical protein